MNCSMPVRHQLARHEAAHSLAMLEYDLSPRNDFRVAVHNEPVDGLLGSLEIVRHRNNAPNPLPARYPASLDPWLRVIVARSALVAYAGVAAEMPRVRDWTDDHAASSATDRRLFGENAWFFGFDPPSVWITAYHAAISFVDRSWIELQAVAAALEQRDSLTANQVRAIVAESPQERRNPHREPAPWPGELIDLDLAETLEAWRIRPAGAACVEPASWRREPERVAAADGGRR